MNTKIISVKNTLYYRELGEMPKLRRANKIARENRQKNRLDLAVEYFSECLKNPTNVHNYELKFQKVR